MKRVKIEGFKGHWEVKEEKLNEFIQAALAVPPNKEYGYHIFNDLEAALSPLARRISAAEEAEAWKTWNYNIPEFGSKNAPKGPEIYINLDTSSVSTKQH